MTSRKPGDEIDAHLKQTGFDKNFPPPGVEVVSWYVMMDIGGHAAFPGGV